MGNIQMNYYDTEDQEGSFYDITNKQEDTTLYLDQNSMTTVDTPDNLSQSQKLQKKPD